MAETVLFAGLVNWLVTIIVVESELFREVRALVDRRAPPKLRYLVHCHLCSGTWVGLGLALFVPGPFHMVVWPVSWLLDGLLYKAVGHFALEAHAILKHHNALLETAERNGNGYHGNHLAGDSGVGRGAGGAGGGSGAHAGEGADGHRAGRLLAD